MTKVQDTKDIKAIIESQKRGKGRPKGSRNKNYEYNKDKREREAAIKAAWLRGMLKWKLDSNQQDLYDMYHNPNNSKIVVLWSRQIGKCVSARNHIATPQGIKKMEDIQVGDYVMGYNSDGSISPAKVTNKIDSGKKDLIKLTSHGREMVSCSKDHNWLTVRPDVGKLTEKQLKDFKSHDKIVRKFTDIPGGDLHESHAYTLGTFRSKDTDLELIKSWNKESRLSFLAGLMDTEGSVSFSNNETGKFLKVKITSQKKEIIEVARYIIYSHFQYDPLICEDKNQVFTLRLNINLFTKRLLKELNSYVRLERMKWKEEYLELEDENVKEDYIGLKQEESIEEQAYDITIDNETSLYLTADGLVTHNSFTVMDIISEELIKHEDWRIGYIAPKKSQAKKITSESINDIFKDAPDKMRPKYNTIDSYWQFPKGGRLYIAGTDNGNVETMRGSTFDRVFIDEFCFLDDFNYCLKSVIMPTLSSKDDTKLVMISSPPKTFDHPSNDWIDKAEADKSLIVRTVYDCPRYNEHKIAKIIENNGPEDSVDFQREYMCKRIPDIRSLVLPECNPDKMDELITGDYERPVFFKACISADWGVMDSNFVLFAYYDFKKGKIVIDDELEISGTNETTEGIAKAILSKEKELWNDDIPRMRYCDINLQLINDLNISYGLQFLTTAKDNLQAAVNAVRGKVQNNELIINPKCVNLISQMKSASWDKSRKKFKRTNGHHYDGIAALVYLIRNIDLFTNPFPPGYNIPDGSFLSPKYYKKRDLETQNKFDKIFNINRRKRKK